MRAFYFYPGDWKGSSKVRAMDGEERSAYLNLLLIAAEEPDCGLPSDPRRLAILSELSAQWFKETLNEAKRIPELTSGEKILENFFYVRNGSCFSALDNSQYDPNDDPKAKARIDPRTLREGRIYNAKLLRERIFQKTVNDKRASSGRAGANSRWQKDGTSMANAIPIAIETDGKTEDLPWQTHSTLGIGCSLEVEVNSSSEEVTTDLPTEPSEPNREVVSVKLSATLFLRIQECKRFGKSPTKTLTRLLASDCLWNGWLQFWDLYPLKVGEADAFCAWWELCEFEELTESVVPELLDGVRRHITCVLWARDNGQYICKPATFLIGDGGRRKGRMWRDHPQQLTAAQAFSNTPAVLPKMGDNDSWVHTDWGEQIERDRKAYLLAKGKTA
jgi:hypothetical protein